MTIDLRRDRRIARSRERGPRLNETAAPADLLKTRLARMVALGTAVLVTGLGVTTLLFDERTPSSEPEGDRDASQGTASGTPAATDLTSYAFLLPELEGLPPTTSTGTEIEIWATWEPPVTKRLKIQRLIPKATVTKILPSIEPGPPTVVLELERRFIPDIMFGDRFGALSVVLASESD
jgi:hypothetical protein